MTSLVDQIRLALKRPAGAALALLALCLALYLPGQTALPPFDRDEPRFAQATRQMLETGDFVDIRYQDVPRYLQPAGIYWLQAASVSVFGSDAREIWPHRIPSWLSAIAVTFLTWWVAGLLFGRTAGRAAAVLMAASMSLGAEARFAKIDATLCAATLAAQTGLAKVYLDAQSGARAPWRYALLFWAALGIGVLLKGPIILLVSGGTVLGLLALERKYRWLGGLRPLWGVPVFAAIAAPWYIAINAATNGDFFRVAVGYSVAGKIAGTHQSHGGPPGYHAALFNLTFWPGTLFAWLAAPFAWRERTTAPVRFCLAWIIPAWIVFELSGTKLPHYTLPLLPAVAALSAAALLRVSGRPAFGRPILFTIAAIFWSIFGLIVVAAAPVVHAWLEGPPPLSAILLSGLGVAAMIAVIVLSVFGRARQAIVAAAAAAFIVAVNTFQVTLPAIDNGWMSPRIVEAAREEAPCGTTRIISTPYAEPSFVFLAGGTPLLAGSAEEAADAFVNDGDCALALIGADRRDAFLERLGERGVSVQAARMLEGYNYSEGDPVQLTLYRRR
ncbi:MAG: phospholipid carrier-dependent glycosyltransferase [Alphaproteobacteria bacterium]|nr:phospholipid carrier-dependent glycosyltransferase [Alphaproteobacteria bacterium]